MMNAEHGKKRRVKNGSICSNCYHTYFRNRNSYGYRRGSRRNIKNFFGFYATISDLGYTNIVKAIIKGDKKMVTVFTVAALATAAFGTLAIVCATW